MNKNQNITNQVYIGSENRASLIDLNIPENFNNQLIIFIHGYMGYKDWGCWNLVGQHFSNLGYGFCKYTVSHNGGTVENPIDFTDLDAFSINTYSKELNDVSCVLSWLESKFEILPQIHLIGHSRGGGIALLAAKDERITKVISWAGICDIEKRFPTGTELKVWKTQGTRYTLNSRTNQKMPHKYIQFEDFEANKEILNIQKACEILKKSTFLIHGDADTSVDIEEGRNLATWLKTRLFEIEEADHTFGSSQPWNEENLPEALQKVCDLTTSFLSI
ncbi:MAG: prolyl oligopeptidase family serine peptidase [Flavobacteriia bacterium]|nr:prolyl oligopeptidase family serine peptidase [Flavobacteriia bacterium]